MGRRAFLLGSTAFFGLALVARPAPAQARIADIGLAKKTITGYSWPWTGRPGETIDFKISTYAPGAYTAEIVRLICADAITDGGLHFKEEVVKSAGRKSYPGRTQHAVLGSYAETDLKSALPDGAAFTLALSVFPTKVPRGSALSAAAFAPLTGDGAKGVQHLVSRWNGPKQSGWALLLEEAGRVVFQVGDGPGAVRHVTLSDPLVLRRWVRLTAAYDPASGQVALTQTPIYNGAGDRAARKPQQTGGPVGKIAQAGPLRFGAAIGEPAADGIAKPLGGFNGKLDRVRLVRGALDGASLAALHDARPNGHDVVAWWDFAQGAGTTRVHDISGAGLHGHTFNLPERAVIGVAWDGKTLNWTAAPDQYSAMYFHEDALSDCRWATDFAFRIPAGLRSGIYAAKLRHGTSEAYIPFYVAAARTKPKAKVALVVPTLTYLAYANALGASYWTRDVLVSQADGSQKVEQEEWMPIYVEEKSSTDMIGAFGPAFGMGVYRFYVDGAPVHHAPMRIPNLANHPKALNKNTTADTDIIEWLEHDGIDYDVVTDELLHAEGADLLKGYAAVLTGSHTEYLTWEMYRAYMDYTNAGGRLMSIGGNGFHNRIAFHQEVPGVVECRKKMGGTPAGLDYWFEAFGEFDGLPTGKFKEIGSPANVVHGLGTTSLHPLTAGTYYVRAPGADDPRAAFALDGVAKGEKIGNFGKSGGGAAGEEVDHADLKDGTPAHTLILARSESMVWPMVSEDGLTDPKYRTNFDPRADIVFFETPGGGAVFSVGSMGWRASLSHNGFENNVARITRNVLRRFLDPTPFVYPA